MEEVCVSPTLPFSVQSLPPIHPLALQSRPPHNLNNFLLLLLLPLDLDGLLPAQGLGPGERPLDLAAAQRGPALPLHRPHPHCPPTTRTRILRSPPRPPTRSPASHSAPSPTCWSRAHGTTRSGAGTCSRRARRYPRRRPTTTSRCCARRGARTGAPSFQVREEGGESVFVMGGAFCRACCALRLLPFCRRETASVCAYMWACLTGAAVR